MKAPCKDCPDRTFPPERSCHTYCEKYLKYQKEQKILNERIRKEKDRYSR